MAPSVIAHVICGVPGSHRSGAPACVYPVCDTDCMAHPHEMGEAHDFWSALRSAKTPIPVSAPIL